MEHRSVCWGMEVGVPMFLTAAQILALVYLYARRTRIRREQAEVNFPFQDLKQAAMGLAWQTPVDVRSLQPSVLANCLLTWADRRLQGKG